MSEIVVTGKKSSGGSGIGLQNLDYRLPMQDTRKRLGISDSKSGGDSSRSLSAPMSSTGPRLTPTAISQPRSTLGTLTGTAAPKGYGVKLSTAFKKGGFAVKPVWDKERPKDLGKPKDLSVKKKKSAKARAKAAGRPYPNLIDNMAAARKKGK